uniref:Uncharacterized protein n=1 Tax=Arundo donax TaxID=35708 RepID=A0A0A9BE94_ARUDO
MLLWSPVACEEVREQKLQACRSNRIHSIQPFLSRVTCAHCVY